MPDKKEDQEKDSADNWKYSGKEEEWETFDRRITRYCEKKYDLLGKRFWNGTLPSIVGLDPYDYYEYCCDVWRTIEMKDATQAKTLWLNTSGFFERAWQLNWVDRQYRLLVIYIEEHCEGAAEIEMINFDGDKSQIRKHLYKLFGAGTGGDIHTIELEFDKGMPEKGKPAFYKGIDMIEKLRQLETRRLYFLKMCSPSRQSTYPYCQENKLVRIVLDHIHPEYDDCIARLLDLVKVNKMLVSVSSGAMMGANSFEALDSHERSFSDECLPSWKLLQTNLVAEYKRKLKAGEEVKNPKDKGRLPVALAGVNVKCYACGGAHKRGDPACKAGPNDVHKDAPEHFKKRQAAKKRKGEQGGNDKPKNDNQPTNKKLKEGEKKHCHQFNFGKGTCRFGAKCRFLHEKGDGKSPDNDERHGFNKKQIAAIIASTIRKTAAHIHKKSKASKESSSKKTESEVDSEDYAAILAACMLAPVKNTIPRNRAIKGNTVMASNLHDVETTCGIDTDAGMSISTMRDDFPCCLDESVEAKSSIEAPAGINGGQSSIGGRGPMIVRTKSGQYLMDPDGIFLSSGAGQPNFRVLSAQRLK